MKWIYNGRVGLDARHEKKDNKWIKTDTELMVGLRSEKSTQEFFKRTKLYEWQDALTANMTKMIYDSNAPDYDEQPLDEGEDFDEEILTYRKMFSLLHQSQCDPDSYKEKYDQKCGMIIPFGKFSMSKIADMFGTKLGVSGTLS